MRNPKSEGPEKLMKKFIFGFAGYRPKITGFLGEN
jgi:hypothetical protein